MPGSQKGSRNTPDRGFHRNLWRDENERCVSSGDILHRKKAGRKAVSASGGERTFSLLSILIFVWSSI